VIELPPKRTVAGIVTEKKRGKDGEDEAAATEGGDKEKEKAAEKK
jgi:hypothetical protein